MTNVGTHVLYQLLLKKLKIFKKKLRDKKNPKNLPKSIIVHMQFIKTQIQLHGLNSFKTKKYNTKSVNINYY